MGSHSGRTKASGFFEAGGRGQPGAESQVGRALGAGEWVCAGCARRGGSADREEPRAQRRRRARRRWWLRPRGAELRPTLGAEAARSCPGPGPAAGLRAHEARAAGPGEWPPQAVGGAGGWPGRGAGEQVAGQGALCPFPELSPRRLEAEAGARGPQARGWGASMRGVGVPQPRLNKGRVAPARGRPRDRDPAPGTPIFLEFTVFFLSPCLSEVCGLVHEGPTAARRRWGWFGPRSRSGLGFGEA